MITNQPSATQSCILTADDIQRKLRRMALQIAENNTEETSVVIAAINGNGEVVAQNLIRQLKGMISIPVEYCLVKLAKKQPAEVSVAPAIHFDNKVVIIVDDVADTGKTMLYALKPFLEYHPKKIQTLVLVERSHKLFPVNSDYVGVSLATTLQEHIRVEIQGDTIAGAFLH